MRTSRCLYMCGKQLDVESDTFSNKDLGIKPKSMFSCRRSPRPGFWSLSSMLFWCLVCAYLSSNLENHLIVSEHVLMDLGTKAQAQGGEGSIRLAILNKKTNSK